MIFCIHFDNILFSALALHPQEQKECLYAQFQSVLIIGTDCFEMKKEHIEKAFESLETFDFVIGPAKDGGYYLLGSTFLEATIFMGKTWSSDTVYKETLQNFDEIGLDYTILETLSDIDTIDDLKELKQTFNV